MKTVHSRRLRHLDRALLSLAAALSLAGSVPSASAAEPLLVLAAGSLKTTFTAIIARWQALHPEAPVQMHNGPAGWLRQRIEQGERFDLYASAALSHAEAVSAAGFTGPAVLFARNRLCALVQADAPVATDTLVDWLLLPTTRIATSTPRSDPGGDYAWAFFRRVDASHPGAYRDLTQRAQQLYGAPPDAAQPAPPSARALIGEGRVDVALGYCSGMGGVGPQLKALPLPAWAPVPDYGLAVSRRAAPTASEFALFVLSPTGQRILAEHGFAAVGLPSEAP
jgi:ABC-type molybdate transport system substrate-binding protein